MISYYFGAALLTLSLILHIVGIGTARFSYSDEFKAVEIMHHSARPVGESNHHIQYGLFRLCTDACLYERAEDYECSKEVNVRNSTELKIMDISKSTLCFSVVPAESQEMYGENQIKAPGWLIGAQALCITGIFVSLLGGFVTIIILQVVNKSRGGEQTKGQFTTYAMILAVSFIIGGVISLVGDTIFGTQHVRLVFWDPDGEEEYYDDQTSEVQDMYDDMIDLSWGFWLDVTGGILSIIAGVILCIGVSMHGPPKKTIGQGMGRSA